MASQWRQALDFADPHVAQLRWLAMKRGFFGVCSRKITNEKRRKSCRPGGSGNPAISLPRLTTDIRHAHERWYHCNPSSHSPVVRRGAHPNDDASASKAPAHPPSASDRAHCESAYASQEAPVDQIIYG